MSEVVTEELKSARDYIVDWLSVLIAPDQVFEVRGIGGRKFSGFFDSNHINQAASEALRLTSMKYRDQWSCHGVYWTINPLDPAVLARRSYRTAIIREGEGACDNDVIRRDWMLIDCDPVRKAGISSSVDEKKAAFEVILNVRSHLKKFYEDHSPILADSGNGFHLLYPVKMENNEASKLEIKDILHYLAGKFDTDMAKIDKAVFNASRICKIYGTWSRKGDSTGDRPHARSMVIG